MTQVKKAQKSVKKLLDSSQQFQLQKLLDKVKQLRHLNQHLSDILEPNLRNSCQIANYEKGKLTILIHNASVATRIRYAAPEILRKLRAFTDFQQLHEIKCLVQPEFIRSSQQTATQKKLSTENEKFLELIKKNLQEKQ